MIGKLSNLCRVGRGSSGQTGGIWELCGKPVLTATLNFIRFQIVLNLVQVNTKLLQTRGIILASDILAPGLLQIRILVVDLVSGLNVGRGEQC